MRGSSQPLPPKKQPRLRSASPTIRNFPVYKEEEEVNHRINSLRPKLPKSASNDRSALEKRCKALIEAVDETSTKVDKVRYENIKLMREIKELEISRKWFYFQGSPAWQD